MSTKIFQRSRAGNSEINERMRPEFELIRDFMPVQVTWKFDDGSIKIKALSSP